MTGPTSPVQDKVESARATKDELEASSYVEPPAAKPVISETTIVPPPVLIREESNSVSKTSKKAEQRSLLLSKERKKEVVDGKRRHNKLFCEELQDIRKSQRQDSNKLDVQDKDVSSNIERAKEKINSRKTTDIKNVEPSNESVEPSHVVHQP